MKAFNKGLLRRRRDYFRAADVSFIKGTMGVRNALQDVQREIAVMKKLAHTNVLRLHEVIDDDEEDKLYMVMDFCDKGPILDWEPEQSQFISPWNDN